MDNLNMTKAQEQELRNEQLAIQALRAELLAIGFYKHRAIKPLDARINEIATEMMERTPGLMEALYG